MSKRWIISKDAHKSKASFPELFFDLVFVFGLIQLSHTLATDFSPTAAVEAAILILAVWWVWINTTWVTNLLDTEREPVRYMLFALMFAGILMAIALPEAFGEHALPFAAIYVAMQVGRSAFAAYAFGDVDQPSAKTFLRITLWAAIAGIFWIAGALSTIDLRIAFWIIAISIEYAAPLVRYFLPGLGNASKETLSLSGEHMAERCALFVIICLGETILTTGRNAVEHMAADRTFVVFCSAFLSTVIMWWIYFHHGQEEAAEKVETTSSPETVAHNLFTYGHFPIVAGIILTAVGEDFSLSHAGEEGNLKHGLAMLGGPALFLCGNIWVKMASARQFPLSHLVGLLLLGCVAAIASLTSNYIINLCATASLLVVAAWEYFALKGQAASTA